MTKVTNNKNKINKIKTTTKSKTTNNYENRKSKIF